jgi:hypothetical protein
MASSVVLKALGLNTSPNQLEAPDGSLVEASNVNIRRDNSIEPRRGFKLDGDSFGTSTDRLKQLLVYKNRILRQYANTLQFESGTNNDGTRAFSNFSGSYSETQEGLRIKSNEAKGNLYFTTSEGIKKISAKTADQLSTASGYITKAGGVKAIDLEASLNSAPGNQTGFLPEDSAVAYRVVWGTNDANNNLILGTPSERSEVYNTINSLTLSDFSRVLGALDDIYYAADPAETVIDDGDYVNSLLLDSSASASELRANVLALATKLDEDIVIGTDTGAGALFEIDPSTVNGVTTTINFGGGGDPSTILQAGDKVFLKGFTSTSGDVNGMQTLTAVTSTSISFLNDANGTLTITSGVIESAKYRDIVSTGTADWPTSLESLVLSTVPTYQEQKVIQVALERILFALQEEPTPIIGSTVSTDYLLPIDITTTSTVNLIINIPSDVTSNYFFQIYRSNIAQATGTTVLQDLTPSDEMQLVYEAYPTSAELTAKEVIVEDIVPDVFRGANLYTNEATGEGALQSNDVPPFAKDIVLFKNSMFYANTKTKQRKLLSLLGVAELISAYNSGTTPILTISNGVVTENYTFVTGLQEVTEIECVADTTNSLNGKYFTLNTAYDAKKYYVWYKTTGGAEDDPEVTGRTGIKVLIETDDTVNTVALKTAETLARYINDFDISVDTDTITVTNLEAGPCTNAGAGDSGFVVTVTTNGRGEDASSNQILLSQAVSPAIAVDETARSMVRVINKNSSALMYAYYLSGALSVPGQMFFESKILSDDPVYFLVNTTAIGTSFSPDIGPTLIVSTITAGAPTVNEIVTSSNHNLVNGDKVMLSATTTTPVVNGLFTATVVNATTFRINTTITVGDASPPAGVAIPADIAETSSNEEAVNRVYYSKQDQPESVPIVNYFDVGAGEQEILRIVPLSDSLFVFKTDGVYRVSGETPPFSQQLFDSSFDVIAPDSVDVCNNEIYAWTTQGVSKVTEGGTTPAISRPIDIDILKLNDSRYPYFSKATFGLGYESENAYCVWTVNEKTDETATICYRYCTLTNTWTTYDISNTCGIVSSVDDRLYLGAGDVNYMEQERKDFERTDYTDREYINTIGDGNYLGQFLKLNDISDISKGDVIIQNQTLTIYTFNSLLEKLDMDLDPGATEYFDELEASPGDDLREKLVLLAQKLDSDIRVGGTNYEASIDEYTGSISSVSAASPSVVTTSSSHNLLTNRYVEIAGTTTVPSTVGSFNVTVTGGTTFTIPVNVSTSGGASGTWTTQVNTFQDIKACYNIVISKLNADSGLDFTNYLPISDETPIEAVVLEVNQNTNRVKLNQELPFVQGSITVYKSYESSVSYSPQTMGDPLGWKQVYEATVMTERKNFTNATLSFSTDLLPEFIEIPVTGRGTGLFGYSRFGGGFFGGSGGSSPIRTYIPRQCQRCRYINVRFAHKVARESYVIFGITLTGNISQSSRAYRGGGER